MLLPAPGARSTEAAAATGTRTSSAAWFLSSPGRSLLSWVQRSLSSRHAAIVAFCNQERIQVIVVFSAGWQDRYRRLLRHLDEQQFRIQDGCLVLADGRLPTVRDITDPVMLGVHQAAASTIVARDGQAVSGPPAYVPRDVDAELREHLTRAGFVLLVGDSTAGKSRAAFEAVSATLTGHVLIRPSGREAVAAAVDRAARERRCVLWLDDLEGYLGTGGLPAAQLGRLLRGKGHHRVIMATIRPAEQARITANAPGDDAGRQASRDIRQVLDQAHPIRVARMFTGDELKRARTRCWDPRIAEAIDHAATYGIAEYLAAGPELLRMWEDARATDGPNARGAALVAAAIDIRRAGYTFPIPRALLDHVHEQYLADPEYAQAPREPATSAWDWATTCPHWATTPLLRPAGPDLVEVFEYLVDTVQRRVGPLGPVPEPVVRAAIDSARPVDSDSLAATAYAQGRYSLAEHAWRKAYHAKASDPAIGPDHPDTLDSRSNLARVLAARGGAARGSRSRVPRRAGSPNPRARPRPPRHPGQPQQPRPRPGRPGDGAARGSRSRVPRRAGSPNPRARPRPPRHPGQPQQPRPRPGRPGDRRG